MATKERTIINKNSKEQALFIAAEKGDAGEISRLIADGACVSARRKGLSPLHYAAAYGKPLAVRALIGAVVDAKNDKGETPLHFAAKAGEEDTVHALIYAGAKVDAINNNGETPLHYAAARFYTGVAIALIKSGADMHRGNHQNKSSLMFFIEKYGADSDAVKSLCSAAEKPE